MMEEAEQASQ
jgi:broad specificity phosphatase PhoE